MDINEIMRKQREEAHHTVERMEDQNFQIQMQSQMLSFQREQTDRFIQEYQETNKRLVEINESLQKQVDEAKQDASSAKRKAKISSIRSWISVGIAGVCCLLEILKSFHVF